MVLGHELTYFVKHETKARQTVLHWKWTHQYVGVFFYLWHICRVRRAHFFNKSSASLWGQTVPFSFPIFFYTPMRLSLYKNLCFIYVICVCLRIVVSNTHCVVFLLSLSSSFVPCVASFSVFSIFDCAFDII